MEERGPKDTSMIEPDNPEPETSEPTVLDYLKSWLTPWKGAPIPFPSGELEAPSAPIEEKTTEEVEAKPRKRPPWRALIALLMAVLAQRAFAPPTRSVELGILLLLGSVAFVAWGVISAEWVHTPYPEGERKRDNLRVRAPFLITGLLLAVLAFIASGSGIFNIILEVLSQRLAYLGPRDGEFNIISVSFLAASLLFLLLAFWQGRPAFLTILGAALRGIRRPEWPVSISRWSLLALAAVALVLFFRTYQLDLVPPEMVSDHAEKYLDANDILNGHPRVFFPRNGGREAMQFYLLAGLMRYFNAPPTHLTLKISTVLIGLLALPYIYLLGEEVGNRRVALLAFTFAGVAYWTNVVARAGMRLPFFMVFTAAVLFHLLRGIRTGSRNQFILAGIFLGLSFYGYSANRLLPLAVLVAVGLYLVHQQSRGTRGQTVWQTILLALMALVVFLPLLRYVLYDPTGFSQRMLSRMSGTEVPLPGPAPVIFLDNLWRALAMFSWSNGVVWGVSIPDQPALGVIAGGLFYLGVALALARYLRKLHWLDLFLVLSIPVLMLPSILSLAFPAENPNLYRTGGAVVPVFLLVAIALDSLMKSLELRLGRPWGARLAWALLVLLLYLGARQDYDLVFNKYYEQYRLSAWNYSEMGDVIRSFSETIGSPETAWVMGYPHWADTRLVALEAGYPERDYAMFVEGLETTLADTRPKIFLLHQQDAAAEEALRQYYPQGWLQTYESQQESKDFLIFFVPPTQ